MKVKRTVRSADGCSNCRVFADRGASECATTARLGLFIGFVRGRLRRAVRDEFCRPTNITLTIGEVINWQHYRQNTFPKCLSLRENALHRGTLLSCYQSPNSR